MITITLDTNVLYQALYSKLGASFQILELIEEQQITLALTVPVFFEYQDVLYRPDSLSNFGLKQEDVDTVLDLLALVGEKYNVSYLLRPNLPDEGDNLFYECAFVSHSTYLITNNTRDFFYGELKTHGFKICTPVDFYSEWRREHE